MSSKTSVTLGKYVTRYINLIESWWFLRTRAFSVLDLYQSITDPWQSRTWCNLRVPNFFFPSSLFVGQSYFVFLKIFIIWNLKCLWRKSVLGKNENIFQISQKIRIFITFQFGWVKTLRWIASKKSYHNRRVGRSRLKRDFS